MPSYATEVYLGGRVCTVDANNPWATAFAVRNGEFIAVGSDTEIRPYIGAGTNVVALGGQFVMPGLIESHVHVMLGAAVTSGLTLDMSDSIDDVLEKVRTYADEHPGRTVFAASYNALLFDDRGPIATLLDQAVSHVPVILLDHTLHGGWANTRALEIAGVTRDTPDPLPALYVRDEHGAPTGALRGGAATVPIILATGAITAESVKEALPPIFTAMSSFGFTAALDCGNVMHPRAGFDALAALEAANELPVRMSVTSMLNIPTQVDAGFALQREIGERFSSSMLWADTLKILSDSVIENQTAAMVEPYESSGDCAELYFTPTELSELVARARALNQAVIIHAIGDRAVRECLNVAESLRSGGDQNRFIITHVQTVHPKDRDRFGELDVIVQTTGNWANFQPGYIPLLGRERNDVSQFPFRSWRDSGATVALGADWPATPGGIEHGMNPWLNMATAMQRRLPPELLEEFGSADQVLEPAHEVLTLTEAIEGYTLSGAKLLGREATLGSIQVGKNADFIVLDRDPYETPVELLWKTKTLATYLGGTLVFERDNNG